jgi:hypothetical protein
MNDLADTVQRIAESARSIVQLELQLAIAELKKKAETLGIGVGLLVGALMFLWLAILFVLGAATAGLTYVMPVWAALLVMCGLMLIVTFVLGAIGVRLVQSTAERPLPEEAIAEAQLTMDELQEELRDAGIA